MTEINLASIGITSEDLQDRIVDRMCDRLISGEMLDDEGNSVFKRSGLMAAMEKRVKATVEAKIDAVFQEHILPNVHTFVDNLVLQERTKWGEKKGEPRTFVEYLVERANDYIQEDVNFRGEDARTGGYNWKKDTTRIAYMVHEHIQYNIDNAVKKILSDANNTVVGGLEKAFRTKLDELKAAIKVTVST